MTESTATPTLLSTREAASYLHVPVPTLNHWRAKGTGPPYIKFSDRIYKYDQQDLDAYLRELRRDPREAEAAAG